MVEAEKQTIVLTLKKIHEYFQKVFALCFCIIFKINLKKIILALEEGFPRCESPDKKVLIF